MIRILIALPLVTVLTVPYVLATGFVMGTDWIGGRFGWLYAASHNRDLANSGWKPPRRFAPVVSARIVQEGHPVRRCGGE